MSVLLLLFQTIHYQPLSKKTHTMCVGSSVSTDGFMTAFERIVVQIRGVLHGHEMNKGNWPNL